MQIGLSKLPTPPLKTSASQTTIFEIVLLAVVAGLIYYFLIMPKQQEVKSKTVQIEQLDTELKNYQASNDALAGLAVDLKKNKDSIEKLDQALPLNSKTTSIYILLENLAQHASVTLSNVGVGGSSSDVVVAADKAKLADPFKAKRAVGNYKLNFSIEGTFETFSNFLSQLEKSGRIVNIKSIQITSQQQDTLSFTVNAEIYYYE